ncbi:MAG: terpene cyclase/mutase family protein [Planctomycetes bacterium]|nr:terpene cyclase/mutase family protein [Planctomycetota bacterium]
MNTRLLLGSRQIARSLRIPLPRPSTAALLWVSAAVLSVGSAAPGAVAQSPVLAARAQVDSRGLPARNVAASANPKSAAPQNRSEIQAESESGWRITDEVRERVDRGLQWLAARQQPDGSWLGDVGFKLNNSYHVVPEGDNRAHVGVTAIAGIAFLANGQIPGRGKYGAVVDKALAFVSSCVEENGFISSNQTRMYSHAFGTLFLAEALGMSHRPDLREKLQDAVRLIVDSQNSEGGWRYVPFAKESDMSITVCQVMALRAARNVGIPVPKATIDRAIDYVKKSAVRENGPRNGWGYDDEVGAFRYQVQTFSRSTFPLTAAGVVSLNGAGVYSDRDIDLGLDYLDRNLRGFSSDYGGRMGHYFFYYGHYYAVQAMFVAQGPRGQRYWEHIKQQLIGMQEPDGSWPNHVGPGPNFATAVATLILQIPYRFLPIFQR